MQIRDSKIFDPDVLLSMLGEADNSTLIDFYGIYLEHTTSAWADILELKQEQKWSEIKSLSHSLKSSSRSIGAIAFGELMSRLETATKEGNPAPDLVEQGILTFQETRNAIQEHMTALASK